MKSSKKIVILLIALSVLVTSFVATADRKEKKNKLEARKSFSFEEEQALQEWKEKIFKGRVVYTLEEKRDQQYVRAISHNSASSLYYRIRFSPKEYPMISWKWKVEKFPDKTGAVDRHAEEWDDYAARIYVIFPSGTVRATKCLEYIWDEETPEGTIITSPYSPNLKLIVVQSGKNKTRDWVFEEQNIYEDYIKAFGYPPKLRVGAVAFMTDTDTTSGTAEAYYDEIKVGYSKEGGGK